MDQAAAGPQARRSRVPAGRDRASGADPGAAALVGSSGERPGREGAGTHITVKGGRLQAHGWQALCEGIAGRAWRADAALRLEQVARPGIGDAWLFPAPEDPDPTGVPALGGGLVGASGVRLTLDTHLDTHPEKF
jgi:hypothetical protein